MYYTREQIRSFIRCPQLGSEDYGEWGALRVEQRLAINSMLDQLDSADAYIRQLEKENESLVAQYEWQGAKMVNEYILLEDIDKLFIPKSVIREKIEELKHEKYKRTQLGVFILKNYDNQRLLGQIQVLKELLGDENEDRN